LFKVLSKREALEKPYDSIDPAVKLNLWRTIAAVVVIGRCIAARANQDFTTRFL
jgi:hypothetical protein